MLFKEQINFFRKKINLPTHKWDDLIGAKHNSAFVVAGALKADLLNDLNHIVKKAITDGITIDDFRKDFLNIVAKNGWTNWTGEGTKSGVAWRTKIIYDTNLFSSYSAGRYSQLLEIAHERPYWRYKHNDAVIIPRPLHVSWDGLVIHYQNPWWQKHFPPNGFGCKCYIESLGENDLTKKPNNPPDNGTYQHTFSNGQTKIIPKGIDPGWDYVPGNPQALIDFASNKAASYTPQIKLAYLGYINAHLNQLSDTSRTDSKSD